MDMLSITMDLLEIISYFAEVADKFIAIQGKTHSI